MVWVCGSGEISDMSFAVVAARTGLRRGRGEEAAKERDDLEIRDALKVSVRPDRVAEFQSACADDQIGKGKVNSISGLFSADASNYFRRSLGDRMDGNGGFQFIQERATPNPDLWRV